MACKLYHKCESVRQASTANAKWKKGVRVEEKSIEKEKLHFAAPAPEYESNKSVVVVVKIY